MPVQASELAVIPQRRYYTHINRNHEGRARANKPNGLYANTEPMNTIAPGSQATDGKRHEPDSEKQQAGPDFVQPAEKHTQKCKIECGPVTTSG